MSTGYSDFSEDYIRLGLERKGWYVISTGKINDGGAPMARSCTDALILPDLQIIARGRNRWVEVKRKTKPAFMHIEQCFKHGFCRRQYDHYTEFEHEAGIQLWIFIWEVENHAICYAPLRYLIHPQFRDPKPFKHRIAEKSDFCEHGMVFFRRDDFWIMNEEDFIVGRWNDVWIEKRDTIS